MKKQLIFGITTFVLMFFALSCNDDKFSNVTPPTSTNSSANERIGIDDIDYESEGIFLYKTLKFHSGHFDPYSLVPENERANFKAKIDSVKATRNSDPNVVWDKGVKEKKVSKQTSDKLKKFKDDALAAINTNANPNIIDKWFVNDIAKTKQDPSLLPEEKRFVIHHSTIMRYALKAYLETNTTNQNIKNGRTSASCTLQMISCYWGNVGTYSGIGGYFGSYGTAVGAIVGVFISFNSCTCEASCEYPKFISTPDICYDQFYGLDLVTGGFGGATNHLTWTLTDPNGAVFLTRDSYTNTTHIYNSDLGGRQYFEFYVTAHCGGGVYSTARIGININDLGKPIFFFSGNSYPQVGSQQFYSISGRNLNTVNWVVGSIGQVLSQNSYGAYVKWNSTGYVYMYANAQSNCGTSSCGLNVVVHN